MKTVKKLRIFFILFGIVGISSMLHANSKDKLRELLKDHPEVAEQFLKKIAEQPKVTRPIAPARRKPVAPPAPKPVDQPPQPQPEPVIPPPAPEPQPQAEPVTPPTPQPKPEPVTPPAPKPQPQPAPVPVKRPWITEREQYDIHSILTILETYAARVFIALESFFSTKNYQPLRIHVTSLKAQLDYLRHNLIQKFPRAEMPERQAIFAQLFNVTKAMEQAQILLCDTLDQPYSSSPVGIFSLVTAFNKISPRLDQQQNIMNQNMTILRKELLSGQQHDLANRINKLQVSLNKIFDYGKNSKAAILAGVAHRLRQ